MTRSAARQSARLASHAAVLALVVLNTPHRVACTAFDSGDQRYIDFGYTAVGWPLAFRGHFEESDYPLIVNRQGKRFISLNFHPFRLRRFLFDVAFGGCLIAAAAELSKRGAVRFSLFTLLAMLTLCACLMGVTVRWDYRTAATVLAAIVILAGSVVRAKRGFRHRRGNSPCETSNEAPPVDPLRQAAL